MERVDQGKPLRYMATGNYQGRSQLEKNILGAPRDRQLFTVTDFSQSNLGGLQLLGHYDKSRCSRCDCGNPNPFATLQILPGNSQLHICTNYNSIFGHPLLLLSDTPLQHFLKLRKNVVKLRTIVQGRGVDTELQLIGVEGFKGVLECSHANYPRETVTALGDHREVFEVSRYHPRLWSETRISDYNSKLSEVVASSQESEGHVCASFLVCPWIDVPGGAKACLLFCLMKSVVEA